MTYVLHASMTPYATGLFIHPAKGQPGDILLILAWLVAFASRTRVRDFERPGRPSHNKKDIRLDVLFVMRARDGDRTRGPHLGKVVLHR